MRKNVTIDWTVRENVRAQLRVIVKRILRKYGYPPDKQEKATADGAGAGGGAVSTLGFSLTLVLRRQPASFSLTALSRNFFRLTAQSNLV